MLARRTSVEEIARQTGLRPILLQRFIELGLIVPKPYYTEAERRELRRARRLIDDLGFEAETVEVLLRMRRRILALEREVTRLQAESGSQPSREPTVAWIEAEWTELR